LLGIFPDTVNTPHEAISCRNEGQLECHGFLIVRCAPDDFQNAIRLKHAIRVGEQDHFAAGNTDPTITRRRNSHSGLPDDAQWTSRQGILKAFWRRTHTAIVHNDNLKGLVGLLSERSKGIAEALPAIPHRNNDAHIHNVTP
jgi:hypothetical protein